MADTTRAVDMNRLRGADALEGFFLEYPQKFDLQWQGHIRRIHHVPVGMFEATNTPRAAAIIGPLFDTKQFDFDQVFPAKLPG